jgi:copper oxidase (laccase) domain-containing protein
VVHAGWRGTVQRITRDAVLAMVEAYRSEPSQLQAVIGPGISLEAFEVGDEVWKQFADASFPMEHISCRMHAMSGGSEQKWHIDLWECNRLQLQSVGVLPQHIQMSGICTYKHYSDFFSARRLGVESGRIYTAAMIN